MWRQYRTIEAGEQLLVGVDTCSGGGDSTAAQCLSRTKLDVPLVFQSRSTTSDFIPELVRVLEAISLVTGVKPKIALERQNGGAFLMDRVAAMNFSGKYDIFRMPNYGREEAPESTRLGWDTNLATRPKGLQELQDAIRNGLILIYDKPTLKEMLSFIVVRTSSSLKAQAERGSHDDLVMALMIVWQMYMVASIAPPETKPVEKDYRKYERFQQEANSLSGFSV